MDASPSSPWVEFEIFECQPDGSVKWCDRATGLQAARSKLDRWLQDTGKEYFALQLFTRDILFARDVSKLSTERAAKRIFQIAYSEKPYLARVELLRAEGFPVISVVGNEAAMALLTILRRDDLNIGLFIVGHGTSEHTRREMVDWLKSSHPDVKIFALNAPNEEILDADYNVPQNDPQTWLPLIVQVMSHN